MFNNSIERLNIKAGDIQLVVYRPKPYSNNRKTILHYHGYGSDVERYEMLGQIFALHGYQFVLPEVESHGVRGQIEDAYDYSGVMEIMNQTFAEYWYIKDLIMNRLNGDIKNFAVSGHSMGGMIASSLFARDLDIKFAIIYNGIADYSYFEEVVENMEEFLEKVGRETMDEFLSFNPANFKDNLNGRHGLFLIGDKDEIVTPNLMENFKKLLEDNNVDIENLSFMHYEDVAHGVAYKMVDDALKYTNERMMAI